MPTRGVSQARERSRRRWTLAVVALLVCALPVPALGTGGGEGEPELSGTYRNTADDHGRRTIEAAVERAIEDLFALARPTARSRLLESNPPIPTVEIAVRPGAIRVDLGSGRDNTLARATWGRGRSADGTTIRLRYTLTSSGTLKMESRTDGGSARHLFSLSGDGRTLRHAVRIQSSHLPDDVRYSLTYRRVP